MPSFPDRLVSGWMVVSLLGGSTLASTKPTVVVPPIGSTSNDRARGAIARLLKESGQVSVVESSAVDGYLSNRMGGRTPSTRTGLEGARKLLSKGQSEYQALNMKAALEYLTKAKAAYQRNLRVDDAFSGLRAAKMNLAMVYLATKDEAKARTEIKEILLIHPDRDSSSLTPKLYPPPLIKLYGEVKKEFRQKERGDLEIESRPSGALVEVDGKSVGPTPVRARELPVGEHYVRLVSEGRETSFSTKFVVSGENRMEVDLKPAKSIDPMIYFAPVDSTAAIDHERAAFLDAMGLSLGADIFVLVAPEMGAVRAQLYDQRSQEISPPEVDPTPEGLVTKLLRHLDQDGYVSSEEAPKIATKGSSSAIADNQPLIEEPKTKTTLTEQENQPLQIPNRPGDKKLWYENKWIWIGVGGALALVGGGVLLFTDVAKGPATHSTVSTVIP